MYLRRRGAIKWFIAAFIAAALYSEWLVFILQPLYWPELDVNGKCQEKGCTKILFIADPQIQGDLAVFTPVNHIFNWDSDWYLKKTFSAAVKHFKPDVLVYLGDLMDEGSIATMERFHHYAKRLMNIFELNYPIVNVWVPGDNDIGGEGREPVNKDKVMEFEKIFWQPDIITVENLSFYKVNAITYEHPMLDKNGANNYKIVVSHYPVTLRVEFGRRVNKEIQPNIYFCAHSHESKYVEQMKDLSHRKTHWITPSGKESLNVTTFDSSLYEVYVPTCSYRMGTNKIGFGAAIFEKASETITYTVFWSPQRFCYLFVYLAFLVIALGYFLVSSAARLLHFCYWRDRNTRTASTKDKVPLLNRI